MQKINFQNLPNTTTPLNATNMNTIQTNVENEFANYYTKTEANNKFVDGSTIYYIGSNEDLNNFTTAGAYSIGGQSPSHSPFTGNYAGLLVVFKSYYVGQLIISSDYYSTIYIRFYNGSTWGNWRALN